MSHLFDLKSLAISASKFANVKYSITILIPRIIPSLSLFVFLVCAWGVGKWGGGWGGGGG